MFNLLLADSSEMVRLGFRSVMSGHNNIRVIHEVASYDELITVLAGGSYQVLVLDPKIYPGPSDVLFHKMRAIVPETKILVFTSMDERLFAKKAFHCGIKGYLMKTCTVEELRVAVIRVSQGAKYISAALSEQFVDNLDLSRGAEFHGGLSDKEFEIFSMLVLGMSLAEVAYTSRLSYDSARTYKMKLMKKLRAASRSDLVQYAISQDLLDDCKAICNPTSSDSILK